MDAQQNGQGTGNEQEVIEVIVQERRVEESLENELIQNQKREADEEHRIGLKLEAPVHQMSARMMRPNPIASSSFASKVIIRDYSEVPWRKPV